MIVHERLSPIQTRIDIVDYLKTLIKMESNAKTYLSTYKATARASRLAG